MDNSFSIERLTTDQFNYICEFIYEETGIVLNEKKTEMVHRRLSKLSRSKGFATLVSYYDYFMSHTELEKKDLINAVTTNLTRFFREHHHFDFLKETYLPWLFSQVNKSKRIRIWSSACSTGEEAYSIAMILKQNFQQELNNWDVKILATDIDTNVLSHAKQGIYTKASVEDIPLEMHARFIETIDNGAVSIAKEIRDLITFKPLNLLEKWPMKGPFDVIFCRNVIIYFDKPTQQVLFDRFHQYIQPKGLLILGHSESLGPAAASFKSIGKTIFKKSIQDSRYV